MKTLHSMVVEAILKRGATEAGYDRYAQGGN
jgi:hypothetical protein